jgi:hypothetical protein
MIMVTHRECYCSSLFTHLTFRGILWQLWWCMGWIMQWEKPFCFGFNKYKMCDILTVVTHHVLQKVWLSQLVIELFPSMITNIHLLTALGYSSDLKSNTSSYTMSWTLWLDYSSRNIWLRCHKHYGIWTTDQTGLWDTIRILHMYAAWWCIVNIIPLRS